MEKKRIEMIEAFLKLTMEERGAESEKRFDEVLEKMAQLYNISQERLMKNLLKIVKKGLSKKAGDQGKMIKVMWL